MIRQTERTTPHRQYIASYEDSITRKSASHNPFIEPMIFSGLGAEMMGGSHYIQDTVEKFDKMRYQRGMPLPDLRFHPTTLAVGENQLKDIYIQTGNRLENMKKEKESDRLSRQVEEEELQDESTLAKLFGGKKKRKGKK
jgi:hypothetical protein